MNRGSGINVLEFVSIGSGINVLEFVYDLVD
jgi:hypothetical protein